MRFIPSVLIMVVMCGCAVELQHDLSESRANDTVTLLLDNGIAATKVRQGQSWMVRVPSRSQARAWRLVQETGLHEVGEVATPGVLSSPAERRSAAALRKARRLEQTLTLIDGVQRARVHLIVLPPAKVMLPGATGTSARASVLLRITEERADLVEQVRKLLTGAVENLAAEDVTVVLVPYPPQAGPAA